MAPALHSHASGFLCGTQLPRRQALSRAGTSACKAPRAAAGSSHQPLLSGRSRCAKGSLIASVLCMDVYEICMWSGHGATRYERRYCDAAGGLYDLR